MYRFVRSCNFSIIVILTGERSAQVRATAQLDWSTPTTWLWNICRKNTAWLLRGRISTRIRTLRSHLWVPADDGLQWIQPWLLFCNVHLSRWCTQSGNWDGQLWDQAWTISWSVHVSGQLQTVRWRNSQKQTTGEFLLFLKERNSLFHIRIMETFNFNSLVALYK